jgi:outer membrane protein assembly factor BamA
MPATGLAAFAALLISAADSAAAQQRSAAGRDTASYEVVKVAFEGNSLLSDSDLRGFIVTEATRCKSPVVYPLCRLHIPFVESEREINIPEVGADIIRIRAQYYLRGYRSTTVDTLIVRRDDGAATVTFRIAEGEPLLIDSLAVLVSPPVLQPARARSLVPVRSGQPVNLIMLDSARIRLRDELWRMGYADAVIGIDTATAAAGTAVTIRVDPRWLARVSQIQVSGNAKVGSQTIRNSMFLGVGQPFRLSDMERSQRALYESGLFSRAELNVIGDSNKVIIVDVDEARLRLARFGAGVSTVEFLRVESQLTNFNWMGGARRVSVSAAVGNLLASQLNGKAIFLDALEGIDVQESDYLSPTWRASGDLRIPWFLNPRNEVSLSAFAQRRSLPGVFIDRSLGFEGVFTREMLERLPVSVGYQFELTRVDAGDLYFCVNFGICDPPTIAALRSTRSLSPLTLSATFERTDNSLSATGGFTMRAAFEHASSLTLSDYRYNRLVFDATRFFRVFENTVLGFHFRGGWVDALGGSQGTPASGDLGGGILHPRKRFFAGGSQSVRGFGEGQLGPRILTVPRDALVDAGCTVDSSTALCDAATIASHEALPDSLFASRPLGGNVLAEASMEIRVPIAGNLGAAFFMDGALVGEQGLSDLKQSTIAVTPGFGLRYRSMAGPIRLDLGYSPVVTDELPVVTEVIDGNQRRIAPLFMTALDGGAPLPARRTFTPPQVSGFFRFLSRFTLHMSIGEAF